MTGERLSPEKLSSTAPGRAMRPSFICGRRSGATPTRPPIRCATACVTRVEKADARSDGGGAFAKVGDLNALSLQRVGQTFGLPASIRIVPGIADQHARRHALGQGRQGGAGVGTGSICGTRRQRRRRRVDLRGRGGLPMMFKPVHLRGERVPFALEGRNAAIGVRDRGGGSSSGGSFVR